MIQQLSSRRDEALSQNRPEYARKLAHAVAALEREGAAMGAQTALRHRDAGEGEFEDAHARKEEIETRRREIYRWEPNVQKQTLFCLMHWNFSPIVLFSPP